MNTSELFNQKPFVMSVEVFPPKRSGTLEGVIRALKQIKQVNPDYVSVTYSAGGGGGDTTADVASIALDAFDMRTVAHLTAVNMTSAALDEKLATLTAKGITDILVLRGDVVEGSRFYDFKYASDVITYIRAKAPSFNLIGACYPEGHCESASLEEDMAHLKAKVDCGLKHLITQLFFDNAKMFAFLERAESAGITVPIEAGIMPLVNASQIKRMVGLSGATVPAKLSKLISKYMDTPDMYAAGLDYAIEQALELKAAGVRGVHLYAMNRGEVATAFFDALKKA